MKEVSQIPAGNNFSSRVKKINYVYGLTGYIQTQNRPQSKHHTFSNK